jgi:hypothetical protein
LESIDLIFLADEDRDQEIARKQTFYQRALQWSVVPRARMAVNEAKLRHKAGLESELNADQSGDVAILKKDSGVNHVEFKG